MKTTGGDNAIDLNHLQKILVVGIGNDYRGDDGIGFVIARNIREKLLLHVTTIEESGDGAALMEAWQGYDIVILVDAISSGAKPGTIIKIDAGKINVPAKYFHCSTHAFGVAEAIALAKAMKKLPPRLLVYGIEGAKFNAGVTLSRVVRQSAKKVIEQILKDVKAEG